MNMMAQLRQVTAPAWQALVKFVPMLQLFYFILNRHPTGFHNLYTDRLCVEGAALSGNDTLYSNNRHSIYEA